MYKPGDYVVYKTDVCKVKGTRKNRAKTIEYYILEPINDKSLIINVPIENKKGMIRDIISIDKAKELIERIPHIQPLENITDQYIEDTYKRLLYNGDHEDLVKVIKTTYLRNDYRLKNNKKISYRDDEFFNKAEEYLYSELAISLGMSEEETKDYVIKKVQEHLE
ncbi:MAG: hypothetical protein GX951_01625 [Mollicutes bacterium]|nr:hypothetical protein [Mollicutes bacterium]